MSEEEPGKILHEVRLGVSGGLALGGKSAYYGSFDATPLFVLLLGEVGGWGFDPETITALLPHADRALEWIRDYGDKDGDGYVEYERLNPRGLFNQGRKDSWDGINFADGTLAEPPIALCEVQAYVYAAYILHITNAPLAGGRITIDIVNSIPSVQGLPEGMMFHRGHRPWMSELVEQANPHPKT
jgi:glycogen debranching enzyme